MLVMRGDKNVYSLLLTFVHASVKRWYLLIIYLFIWDTQWEKVLSGHMLIVKLQISQRICYRTLIYTCKLTRSTLFRDSVSGQRILWSDCVVSHTDLDIIFVCLSWGSTRLSTIAQSCNDVLMLRWKNMSFYVSPHCVTMPQILWQAPRPTSLNISNRSEDHYPWWWKENACLLSKLKLFHYGRKNHCKTLRSGTFWRGWRRFPLHLCRWAYLAKLKNKEKNISETSSGNIFKILVTVLLVSFQQPSDNMVLWLYWYPCQVSTLFTCFLYITMMRTLKNDGIL